ncbi:MAG: STAS domain-containing protein [Candidatus Marinimicrobia bacterium]|nr:STAS domain-containing protein [Candidatus Neomarinimicrobiota bacterium]
MSTKPIIITPESDIVGNSSHELKKEFSTFIENGNINIKLDLHQVRMIDSLGIGVLVATRNALRQAEGEFSIINLNADLRELFSNMRIIEFLNVS